MANNRHNHNVGVLVRLSPEDIRTIRSGLRVLLRTHTHEEGYQAERGPDGTLRFRRPDGRPLPEVPPPGTVPGDPVKALRACHDSNGLQVGARTACAGWLGERLDLGWAIDVLHPRAQRASGTGDPTSLDRPGFGR